MRNLNPGWNRGYSKTITLIVTKDCQLACKYCYLIGKNNKERMSLCTAKKAVDYILSLERVFIEEYVVWEFIGGEPLLEIDLISEICDYIEKRLTELNHRWKNKYKFSISTNGINYHEEKIQQFIKKWHKRLSIGITIDGTEQKHDINRVWKNNNAKGSYKDVVKNIPLWIKQFPNQPTKVTISHEDLPFVKESILHLFSLGIHEVRANVVFENVWFERDDIIFEEQLLELADYIIENRLYEEYVCSLFSKDIGKPLLSDSNWCGAGKMLSIDSEGNIYPCTRFAKYALQTKDPIIIGNIDTGINWNLLRPFLTLGRRAQSPKKCIKCDIASGCAWCQAVNYDSADTDTIFQRSIAVCKMHKARVRANNYYWSRLENEIL